MITIMLHKKAAKFVKKVAGGVSKLADFVSAPFDKIGSVLDKNPVTSGFLLGGFFAGPLLGWIYKKLKTDLPPITINLREPTARIPIIYGEVYTAALNMVFVETTSDNNDLWLVHTIAVGEIDSVVSVRYNDKPSNDFSSQGKLSFSVHRGDPAQVAFTSFVADLPNFTTAHRFDNIAVLASQCAFSASLWGGGIPQIGCRVRGKRVLTDLVNQTNWAWSDNPVLILYDFMTSPNPNGMGMASNLFDAPSIQALAATCDLIQSNSEKLFVLNKVFDPTKKSRENMMEEILQSFRGNISFMQNGLITFQADLDVLPSYHFDNTRFEIARAASSKLLNEVEITFTDIENERKTVVHQDAARLAQDNGRLNSVSFRMSWDTSPVRAKNLGKFILDQSRADLLLELTTDDFSSFQVDVNDVVEVTLDELGFVKKLFKIREKSFSADMNMTFSLTEHVPSNYSLISYTDYIAPPLTLPDPSFIDVIQNLVASSRTMFTKDGEAIQQQLLTWTHPDGAVSGFHLEQRETGTSTWLPGGFSQDASILFYPAATQHDFRVKAENHAGALSLWVELLNQTFVPSADPRPTPQVKNLLLRDGGSIFKGRVVELVWDMVNMDDEILGGGNGGTSGAVFYRVRVFETTGNTLLREETVTANNYQFSIDKNISDSLALNVTSNEAYRALTFSITAISRSGIESATPAVIAVTNPAPDVSELAWNLQVGHQRITVEITTMPLDSDMKNIDVHLSQVSNFIPNAATKIGTIEKTQSKLLIDYDGNGDPLVNADSYNIRLVANDDFGDLISNYTSIIIASPLMAGTTSEDLNAYQSITLSPNGNSWRAKGLQISIDPFGNNGAPGIFCGSYNEGKYFEFSEQVIGKPEFKLGREVLLTGAQSYKSDTVFESFLMTPTTARSEGTLGGAATGTLSFSGSQLIQTNGVLVGDTNCFYRDASTAILPLKWTEDRSLKTWLSLSGVVVGSQQSILTGRMIDYTLRTGTYFGFHILDNQIRCVYNSNSGEQQSATVVFMNPLQTYKFECISNVLTGDINYYIDGVLEHTFNTNFGTWSPSNAERMWGIYQRHVVSAGALSVRYAAVKFLQNV